MTKGAIAPTGAQLSAAIDEEMATQKNTLGVKELQAKLLEHHPNWKIPERRVKKFLKRHSSQHGDPSAAAALADDIDNDDETMATTTSSSKGPAAKRLLKFFKFTAGNKRKSSAPPQSSPEMAPQDPVAEAVPEEVSTSKAESETNLETDQIDDSQLQQLDDVVEQTRSLVQVYSDDNDGKKNDCHCSESCVVM